MSRNPESSSARASAKADGDLLEVVVAGRWQIMVPRPAWPDLIGAQKPARVRLRTENLEQWDSSLLLFLFEAQQWCRTQGAA